jgi:hypothetical protein
MEVCMRRWEFDKRMFDDTETDIVEYRSWCMRIRMPKSIREKAYRNNLLELEFGSMIGSMTGFSV